MFTFKKWLQRFQSNCHQAANCQSTFGEKKKLTDWRHDACCFAKPKPCPHFIQTKQTKQRKNRQHPPSKYANPLRNCQKHHNKRFQTPKPHGQKNIYIPKFSPQENIHQAFCLASSCPELPRGRPYPALVK